MRSLFLPSVWEELPDRRQFLTALKLKAGLAAEHFSPGFRAQRFRSIEVKGAMEAGTARWTGGWAGRCWAAQRRVRDGEDVRRCDVDHAPVGVKCG